MKNKYEHLSQIATTQEHNTRKQTRPPTSQNITYDSIILKERRRMLRTYSEA